MHDTILDLVRQAHALAESAAVSSGNPTTRKQFVLADLSRHLVQAALRQEPPEPADLKHYLFSILTVCAGFVPDLDLKALAKVVLPLPAEQAMLPVPQAASTRGNG